jgi:formylmethanofuran--tetrahydromethanopterin N-formyltransferase
MVEIENTYAEAFEGVFNRMIVTADEERTLRKAAEGATAIPSVAIGRIEGGIERYIEEKCTPDHRKGAILQFWAGISPKKTFAESLKNFEIELSYRIRQGIMVKPLTAVFDYLPKAEGRIDAIEWVGHCGDGYEWFEKRHGRMVVVVPSMVPDFIIERYLGYARGVMGANFLMMCKTKDSMNESGERALKAVHKVRGVVTPFDVCSAGSKPETNFPHIGPTTNHPYCPSLKNRLGKESMVPEDVRYITEIVINGISMDLVRDAMKAGIDVASKVDGVVCISAGNYGGKLGKFKIHLRELYE